MALAHYWFAFDWISYDEKTRDLSLVEHGAYIQLLKHYYSTGSPLPDENEKLARICGAHSTEEISALAMVLRRYFSKESDGWHNKRADEELVKMRRISRVRSNAARSKCTANAPANAEQMQVQLSTHLTTNINTKPKVKSVVHFVHPTLEEVAEYCRSRGNKVNAQHWFDHYSANGWKVGRNAMKDWRAAVRNWERNGALGGSHGTNRQVTRQSRAREVASNNTAAFAAVMGGSALDFGAVAQQGTDGARNRTLEGEVKRLPSGPGGVGAD